MNSLAPHIRHFDENWVIEKVNFTTLETKNLLESWKFMYGPYEISGFSSYYNCIMWLVSLNNTPIGAGEFNISGMNIYEVVAAIFYNYRRKGIYSSIINYIRLTYNEHYLYSDKVQTIENNNLWNKLGAKACDHHMILCPINH